MYFIGSFDDFFFDFFDNFENVRFSIVISVSSDTEVDFFRIFIVIESDGGSKDWIWWSHGDMGEEIVVDLSRSQVKVEFLKSFHC